MVFFSIFTALALIFDYMAPGTVLTSDVLAKVFWSSFFAVTPSYLVLLLDVLLLTIAYLYISWFKIKSILFDRRLAEAEEINTKLYVYTLVALIGFTIVLALRIVGGLLVFALLFCPSTSASKIFQTMEARIIASMNLGALSTILGIFLSYILNLPVGACIVLISVIVLAVIISYSTIKIRISLKS